MKIAALSFFRHGRKNVLPRVCVCVGVCGQGDVSVSGRGKGKEKSRVLGICLFGEIAKYKRYPFTRHLSLRFLTPSLLPSTSRLRVDTHRVLSFPRWMSISVRLSVSRSIKEQETRDEGQGVGYSWVEAYSVEVCQGGRGRN